jgi:predicted RNase H-like HicB family nuclease
MTVTIVSLGSETTSAADLIPSFSPRATVLHSDQPFPWLSVRRYAEIAARSARVEQMEGGRYFAESDVIPGVWGDGDTVEQALHEFIDAVYEWATLKIDQRHGDIPVIGNLDLNVF